ncbi:GyrI-like domain-containing protein [Maribacter aestuarii]|uniref:GyrI-like domain-containing protein n=1 Tax=Maribacter aestuarii TaxID=1130723 RepID=UPI00248C0878|nr:GyrI-like domain-containing protein [Maribacter aestuarii]
MEQHVADFKIIGISIESTNEGGKSVEDMGKLWGKFYSDGISDKIANKESDLVYSIFTDYESDYTGKYTAIIGHKVESLEEIPDGLVGRQFKGGKYVKFVAKGEMPNAVVDLWKKVWKEDKELKRRYTADFEVYGAKSQNGAESEVDVFIATE